MFFCDLSHSVLERPGMVAKSLSLESSILFDTDRTSICSRQQERKTTTTRPGSHSQGKWKGQRFLPYTEVATRLRARGCACCQWALEEGRSCWETIWQRRRQTWPWNTMTALALAALVLTRSCAIFWQFLANFAPPPPSKKRSEDSNTHKYDKKCIGHE